MEFSANCQKDSEGKGEYNKNKGIWRVNQKEKSKLYEGKMKSSSLAHKRRETRDKRPLGCLSQVSRRLDRKLFT